MTLFCELFIDFDCLKDDFWIVDCECNDSCLDLFLSKYLPFVNNVIVFHFQILILMLILLILCLPFLIIDLDLVCLVELKQNHGVKKENMKDAIKLVVQ